MIRGPGFPAKILLLVLFLTTSLGLAQSGTRKVVDPATDEDLESLFDLFGDEGYDDLSKVLPPTESKPSQPPPRKQPSQKVNARPVVAKPQSDVPPRPSNVGDVPPSPIFGELDDPFTDDPPTVPFATPPQIAPQITPRPNPTGVLNDPVPAPPSTGTIGNFAPTITGPEYEMRNAIDSNAQTPSFELNLPPDPDEYYVLEPLPGNSTPIVEPEMDMGESSFPAVELPELGADGLSLDSSSTDGFDGLDLFTGADPTPSLGEVNSDIDMMLDPIPLESQLDPVPQAAPADATPFDAVVEQSQPYSFEPEFPEDVPMCAPDLQMPFGAQLMGLANGSESQYPTSRLTGFFHADYSWFQQNETGIFGDEQDARGFRRARLAAVGSVADNVDYMLEMDFGFAGRPTFMDVYMDVHGFSLGTLRVGQWRQPFGLGELNSVRDLVFHERASMFFLGPFRQTGIGIQKHNGRSTYAFSAFGASTDEFANSIGDSSYGAAGRLTTLLFDNPQSGNLLHIGAGYSHIQPDDFGVELTVPQELFNPGAAFTGISAARIFDANQYDVFNSEIAMVRGRWHAQGEARLARIGRTASPNVFIPAVYAQVGYMLTGESRKYDRVSGSFRGGIEPRRPFGPNGRGAWELAARFSHIDLNHDQLNAGRNNSFTVGLNWYLNRNAKFQFNYLRSIVSRNFFANPIDQHVGSFALRAQVSF